MAPSEECGSILEVVRVLSLWGAWEMGQRFIGQMSVSGHGTSILVEQGAAGDVLQQKNFSMIGVPVWAKTAEKGMGAKETAIGRGAAWRRGDAAEFCFFISTAVIGCCGSASANTDDFIGCSPSDLGFAVISASKNISTPTAHPSH
ncbi:uncharacterized protein MONOS_13733 [Monocercomonoides exilis]|uniref:uncharacterized protein n=1 Tax=Monocercomonoides exilis TaxID=2049356 RepID=UPI00355A26F4|nr:hypothetical protein MONOS_13733 [Monocercomonoides exilis]|eukprot:MONOS_13733.1-p1 / transcript=MONOS_13733.1 / gene=MONOS_13733 / organism=Monocercomonoides_exilis_PA203 / gene_product=unspecified product / transcript_product=unspecified product / location=Mono_scaffold00873:2920-3567(-) / protein_length=146 / sequence_SO=supercontig / SO=protein_coding / is_pseudo=false